MAPAIPLRNAPGKHLRQVARSILSSVGPRSSEKPSTPVASGLSLIGRRTITVASRALSSIPEISNVLRRHTTPSPQPISKRQGTILAIPTTYVGLYAGPAPGAVVGITLGAIAGFLLALWLVYTILRFSGRFGGTTVIEEEVIRRHARSDSRSRSRSETIEIRSDHSPPRRTRRRTEEIIVEEEHSVHDDPPDDDIVEVIEEHSPERRPNRRESKRMSGFRTVDPAEFGGGDRPMRKVSSRR